MKQIFLLPFAFTLLTGCQEPSKIELEPFVPPQPQKKEAIYESPSSLVMITLMGLESEKPALPSQVKVTFEKNSHTQDNLLMSNKPNIENLLYSKSNETLYFGCDEGATEVTLPLKIDALNVVLCGKINVPSVDFNMRASFLELRNAELTTVDLDDEATNATIRMLRISAANMTLLGKNKILLQGKSMGADRKRAPSMHILLGNTLGIGTIDIFSRSSVQTWVY